MFGMLICLTYQYVYKFSFETVYAIKGSNMIVVLQRSLCVLRSQRSFSEELLIWLRGIRSNYVVILTGATTVDAEPSTR